MKHLPTSEPDPHVVRIGWSLDSCSTQLGMLQVYINSEISNVIK